MKGSEVTEFVERLKATVLPDLFRDPATIGEYGRLGVDAGGSPRDALSQLSDLMEGSPVSRLAGQIGDLVAKLTDADPQKIAKPASWLQRLTGQSVEVHVRYQVARKELDDLLAAAEGAAQGVRDAVTAIDRLLDLHRTEADQLEGYILAGQEFLAENPSAGYPAAGGMQFDNPRERFARKLANLATLLASHQMSVTQMQLTKAQALDMLDRFEETARVLVPVWRQHTLALTTTKNMSPGMVTEATRAHDALLKSLAKSMEGLNSEATRRL